MKKASLLFNRIMPSVLCLVLLGIFLSPGANAAVPALKLDVCAPGFQPGDFTLKIVTCVENTIRNATIDMMEALSDYMWGTVAIMMVFAMIIFGFRIMSGEKDLTGKGIAFLIRLGLVLVFSYNLAGLADSLFAIMHALIDLVVGAYSPWQSIDALLCRLFGLGPSTTSTATLTLAQGLVGIIGASLVSSTAGIFLFLAAVTSLINLLLFIFHILFTYLTAVTLLGFLIALSPLVIPLAIFFITERYFKKWMHVLIYSMLVPMMLFAFLWMFLGIFDILLQNIFTILGIPIGSTPNFSAYWRMNLPFFSWLMPADPGYSSQIGAATEIYGVGVPAVQTNITPNLRRGTDASLLNMLGIDFGPNHVGITQQLMLAFGSLWLFASLMTSLISTIPAICNSIAAVGGSYISWNKATTTENAIRQEWGKAKQGITSAFSGKRGG